MAQQTITALFDTYEQAADAVRRLETAGVAHDAISIVSNDARQRSSFDPSVVHETAEPVNGTGIGASVGTVLGGGAGLLAGLGMLAIPGIGPVVAAGWLLATALGAGVGAAAGGLVGALTHAGVHEGDAHAYAEGIRRGGSLVTVRTDETMARQVSEILDIGGAVELGDRQSTWRDDGWTGTYGETPPPAAPAAGVSPLGVVPTPTVPAERDPRIDRDRVRVYPMDGQI